MTRMGLHVHSTRQNGALLDYVRATEPAVVKSLVADRALFSAIKAASPNTRIVYRRHWSDQRFETHAAYIQAVLDDLGPIRGVVDWCEGWNEYTSRDPREQRRFAEHEVRFAQAMLDAGVGAAIGGYSTGFLDSSGAMFEAALPIFELCNRHSGRVVWHSHEYAAPYMQYMARTPDGANQWQRNGLLVAGPDTGDAEPVGPADGWTGYSPDPAAYWRTDLDGYLTLRYRMLWRQLESRGLKGVRMILSETGIDDVNPRPGPIAKGWRDYAGTEWARHPGVGDYADQMRWYGWHISHDPYVIGWVDFGWATEDRAWESFDLSQDRAMLQRMIAEQRRLPTGLIDDTPAPPPPPPPEVAMLKGIDVSTYQGAIDWQKAKRAGVAFAWIRAGGGLGRTGVQGEVDGRFAANVAGAVEAGIPCGPYWWYANGLSGSDQSAAFARVVGDRTFQLPPLLDWELTDAALLETTLQGACVRCEELMGRPMFYTSPGWAAAHGLGAWAWLKRYPLFVAHYTSASKPSVPAPWTDWAVWQHSAGGNGQGPAHGVSSVDVDLDRFRGTLADLLALRVGTAPAPGLDQAAVRVAAQREHEARGVRLNPTAGIQRAMLAEGRVPVTNEFDYSDASGDYAVQVGESLTTGTQKLAYLYHKRTGRIVRVGM